MAAVKNLIIGAGISGLTLAYFLKDDYLIAEKAEQPGGYCKTIKQNGYIWDYAGHFYHFKTDRFETMFEQMMAQKDILKKEKNTKIKYGNSFVDYPFQKNIHQLPQNEFIDCLYDLFNRAEKSSYSNFSDMLYGKFGKSITEKFLRPYNEKLYACDLTELEVEAMGRFFPKADFAEIINNMKINNNSSYNDTFIYPVDGCYSFVEKIYESLNRTKIYLNKELVNVDLDSKTATFSDGTLMQFERLINTTSLKNFFSLLGGEYAKLTSQLSCNKVLVFNLGFDKKPERSEHWIYMPDKTVNYYRIGFYNNILDTDMLSAYIEIGFSEDAYIDVNEQLNITLENMKRNNLIEKGTKLVSQHHVVMNPAYVHISQRSQETKKYALDKLSKSNIYCIGRYGTWTYCSIEDCMEMAYALAVQLNEKRQAVYI